MKLHSWREATWSARCTFVKRDKLKKIGIFLLCLLVSLITTCNTYYRKTLFITNMKEFKEERESSFDWKHSNMKEKGIGNNFYGTRCVKEVECIKLFTGNKFYVDKAKQIATESQRRATSKDYLIMTKDCAEFIYNRGYITDSLTNEEYDFPIAYSIMFHKDVFQVERLLRAIYRPQNVYCLHIDKKADRNDISAIKSIANCFDNVFLVKPLIAVYWAKLSNLLPEIVCMESLIKIKRWKYFLTLTGQEFPLKTNYEIVKILQAYNGANDVEYAYGQPKELWEDTFPPHNITPIRGAHHMAVSRDFVDYVVHNKTAKDILKWVEDVIVPDEMYFSTLNHNPHLGIKGSYTGMKTDKTDNEKPRAARFKKWRERNKCAGKFVRNVCVLGIGDLHELYKARQLYANKFYYNYEHFTLDCMEELIHNRSRDEYLNNITFDTTYYKNLDFVKKK